MSHKIHCEFMTRTEDRYGSGSRHSEDPGGPFRYTRLLGGEASEILPGLWQGGLTAAGDEAYALRGRT